MSQKITSFLSRKFFILLTSISFLWGISVFLSRVFAWEIYCSSKPIVVWEILLSCLIWFGLIGASFIYLWAQAKKNLKRALLPFTINISFILLLSLGQPVDLWTKLKFEWYEEQYREVVKIIQQEKREAITTEVVLLPPDYRYLSCEGEINIKVDNDVTQIFFPIEPALGIGGTVSGYFYKSKGGPTAEDIIARYSPDPWSCEERQPHWFYCYYSFH